MVKEVAVVKLIAHGGYSEIYPENTAPPTLRAILSLLGSEQRVLLDFKQPSVETFETLKAEYDQYISQCILGLRLAEYFPMVQKMWEGPEVLALYANPDDAPAFKKAGGKYFRLIEQTTTQEKVLAIQALGLEVWAVPGNKAAVNQPRTAGQADEAKLRWLVSLGIEGILVNDIKLATEMFL